LRHAESRQAREDRKPFLCKIPEAFDEIGAGLRCFLRSHSKAAGGSFRRRWTGEVGGLWYAATVDLLEILFLVCAEDRGLLGRWGVRAEAWPWKRRAPTHPAVPSGGTGKKPDPARTFALWNELQDKLEALNVRAMGDERRSRVCRAVKVPDAYLLRVLGILSAGFDPAKTGKASLHGRLDVRVLGDAYEVLLDLASGTKGTRPGRMARKATGRYYTPENIVDYMVKAAVGLRVKGLSSRRILALRVLDPSMGSGRFLLAVADYLAAAYGRALVREGKASHGWRIPPAKLSDYKRLVIERCLFGVDTDPIAVRLAVLSLWLEAGAHPGALRELRGHLKCGDALSNKTFEADGFRCADRRRDSLPGRAGVRIGGRTRAPGDVRFGCRPQGFDTVIGNPPYVSLSGRQKPGGGGRGRRAALGAHPKGWPSVHGRFIVKAAELVAPGGTICFIIPAQVGQLPGYGPVRSSLLDVCDLIEVRYLGEDVFKGVTTPTLTFLALRREAGTAAGCRMVAGRGDIRRFAPKGSTAWVVSPNRDLFDRMSGMHTRVDTFADPGVHTGNAASELILSGPQEGAVPIIEGRQIHPFHCDPPGRWLDLTYGAPPAKYFRVSPAEVYTETDIVIRQTAARPVAARHSHRCHFRNSVLALKATDGFSVEYLLGILNSDTARVLYQASSPETLQRSFPQIKVKSLRRLPVPDPHLDENRGTVAQIERTVREIERLLAAGNPAGRVFTRLNLLVRRIYGLEVPSA
jgi:hypothetical protein